MLQNKQSKYGRNLCCLLGKGRLKWVYRGMSVIGENVTIPNLPKIGDGLFKMKKKDSEI